jgi:hypothetical protein
MTDNKFNWAGEIVKHVFLHKYGEEENREHYRQHAEKLIWNAPLEELDKLPALPMKFAGQVWEAAKKKEGEPKPGDTPRMMLYRGE